MKTFLCAWLTATLLAACATVEPATERDSDVEFVVVRHAEKTALPDDPPLSDAGHGRAERLAQSLDGQPLVAAYATGYRRTQQTAAPAAIRHDLVVTTYDARKAAAEFADALRSRHRAGTVLVVGHSNTVPDIAAALCGCAVAPMPESEYGRRMVVTVDADGVARLDMSSEP